MASRIIWFTLIMLLVFTVCSIYNANVQKCMKDHYSGLIISVLWVFKLIIAVLTDMFVPKITFWDDKTNPGYLITFLASFDVVYYYVANIVCAFASPDFFYVNSLWWMSSFILYIRNIYGVLIKETKIRPKAEHQQTSWFDYARKVKLSLQSQK